MIMIRRFGRFGRAACLCGWCGLCYWCCLFVRFVLACAVVRHEGLLVLPATVPSPVLSVALYRGDDLRRSVRGPLSAWVIASPLSLSLPLSLPVRLFNAAPVCGGEKLCVSALH